MRIWIKDDDGALDRVLHAITRTATGGHVAVKVKDTVFRRRIGRVKEVELETLMRKIESCSNQSHEYRNLSRHNYVISKIDDKENEMAIFLAIKVGSGTHNLLSYYAQHIRTTFEDNKGKHVTIHIVDDVNRGDQSDIKLMVQFKVRNFIAARKILLLAYNSLAGIALTGERFSYYTLFDMRWNGDVRSDDGGLFSEISLVHDHDV